MVAQKAPENSSKWMPRSEYEETGKLLRENERLYRESHSDLHKAEEKAKDEMRRVSDLRLDRLNELRSEVITDRSQYVTRKELMAWSIALIGAIAGLAATVIAMVR